jgi:hypothetical protein
MAPSLEKGPPICFGVISLRYVSKVERSVTYSLANLANVSIRVELLANGAAGGDDGRVLGVGVLCLASSLGEILDLLVGHATGTEGSGH